jgi:LuxR family quorum sensing-dependent transcriptional regulator
MSRKSLDQTLEFIRTVDRARSPADVCGRVLRVARRFGAEHVLAGTIPLPGESQRQQRGHILLQHWPTGWAQRYFSRGYLYRDPAIRRVSTNTAPFLWSELDPLCRDNPAARRVMDEAGDFHLKDGFTVPLVTLDGETAGFSLAGHHLEVSAEERGMLVLLATYALGRTIALREAHETEREMTLSPREREALQWAAEGKSEWEIGQLMGISEHGADKHMRGAREKLGTTTRTHAVAEAIRRGLIS